MVKGVVEAFGIKGTDDVEIYVFNKKLDFMEHKKIKQPMKNIDAYLVKNYSNYVVRVFEYTKEEVEQWLSS